MSCQWGRRLGPGARVIAAIAAACFVLVLFPEDALAQSAQRASVEEVKAAFLYNFAAFVDWPARPREDEPFVIGVADAPALEAELRDAVGERRIGKRPVVIRRLRSPADVNSVHIAYVGASDRLTHFLDAARRLPVLTVTEAPDGLDHGAVINFVVQQRVQFEISLEAARAAGLRLSTRLLSVALRVKKGEAHPLILLARAGFRPVGRLGLESL